VVGEQAALAVVGGSLLAEAVGAVAMAVTKDSGLPHLGGVRLAAEGAGFQLSAADGYRLASTWVPAEQLVPGRLGFPATIDARLLKRVGKLLGDEPVRIGLAEARHEPGVAAALSFSWTAGTVVTRVGRALPDWAVLGDPAVAVAAAALTRAILAVAGTGRNATVDLLFHGEGIDVRPGAECAGRSFGETVTGRARHVGSGVRERYDATCLRESLRAFGTGDVTLRPGSRTRMTMVHRVGEEPRAGSGLVRAVAPLPRR
jgi:hypothetical protein